MGERIRMSTHQQLIVTSPSRPLGLFLPSAEPDVVSVRRGRRHFRFSAFLRRLWRWSSSLINFLEGDKTTIIWARIAGAQVVRGREIGWGSSSRIGLPRHPQTAGQKQRKLAQLVIVRELVDDLLAISAVKLPNDHRS